MIHQIGRWVRMKAGLTGILLGITSQASAQFNTLLFGDTDRIDSDKQKELCFVWDNLNFIRDNEYKGDLVKGYTLPGFWATPKFTYQPLKNLKLELGVYLTKYWGTNRYPNISYSDLADWNTSHYSNGFHALPFFRVHYAMTPNFSLVLGNLYGRTAHRLIEPLYNPEMALTSDPEAGLQMLWHPSFMDFDMWINWDSFIFKNDNHRESFIFGLSSKFKANQPESRMHFYFPFQAIFRHYGGEVNTEAEERKVVTLLNGAVGAGLDVNLPYPILNRWNVEVDGLLYKEQTGSVGRYQDGLGLHVKSRLDMKDFSLHAGYWYAHQFVTILGNPLFGTVSAYEDLYLCNPQTAYMRLEYARQVAKGISWGIHADLFNTFPCQAYRYENKETTQFKTENALSFAAGIYLRLNLNFLIKKL